MAAGAVAIADHFDRGDLLQRLAATRLTHSDFHAHFLTQRDRHVGDG